MIDETRKSSLAAFSRQVIETPPSSAAFHFISAPPIHRPIDGLQSRWTSFLCFSSLPFDTHRRKEWTRAESTRGFSRQLRLGRNWLWFVETSDQRDLMDYWRGLRRMSR